MNQHKFDIMKKIYWSERGSVCITAIKKVTDTTLHVLCWVKLLGRHSCWESHLHVRLTSLTVINCICGTERKRTPVSVPYTGYELSVIFFFLKKVFKPMWSLILQKIKVFLLDSVCCLRVRNVVLLWGSKLQE